MATFRVFTQPDGTEIRINLDRVLYYHEADSRNGRRIVSFHLGHLEDDVLVVDRIEDVDRAVSARGVEV